MKRILVVSDLHCGHQTGLTPPDFQYPVIREPDDDRMRLRQKYGDLQREVWKWYTEKVAEYGPFDVCFVMGDCIDGRQEKDAANEAVMVDPNYQVIMAEQALERVGAEQYVMVYGTPYHTQSGYNDWEHDIAETLEAKIGNREFVQVEDLMFDLRHKASKSSIPHGQATLLLKQKLWNDMWFLAGNQPCSNVTIRGHIHDYWHVENGRFHVFSCPALEWGTRYGSLITDGIVNIGMIVLEVDGNKLAHFHLSCQLGEMQPTVTVIP